MKTIPNRFTEFELTNEELYIATRFNQLQLALIQSLLSQAAQRKTILKVDLTNELITKDEAITRFVQQEAELQGEIGVYEHLLTLHRDTEAPKAEEAQKEASIQKPQTRS
jgi:hypothetical protein